MTEIIKDLYQFTEVMEPIKLSVHQYLLMTNEPVLIQTGAVSQAQTTIPKLQELLGERKIKYILISHFESDECGGLALVLKEHPDAVAVCSETTARQMMGFGITKNVLIKKPNEIFAGDDFEYICIHHRQSACDSVDDQYSVPDYWYADGSKCGHRYDDTAAVAVDECVWH